MSSYLDLTDLNLVRHSLQSSGFKNLGNLKGWSSRTRSFTHWTAKILTWFPAFSPHFHHAQVLDWANSCHHSQEWHWQAEEEKGCRIQIMRKCSTVLSGETGESNREGNFVSNLLFSSSTLSLQDEICWDQSLETCSKIPHYRAP